MKKSANDLKLRRLVRSTEANDSIPPNVSSRFFLVPSGNLHTYNKPALLIHRSPLPYHSSFDGMVPQRRSVV